MGDNKISAAVVRLACDAYDKVAQWGDVTNEFEAMNAALESALPHLQGEAVPVDESAYVDVPDIFSHPQPAELSEVPPELAEAIAAGNGTLHGAIDYWQDRALAAEAKLSEGSGDSGELGDGVAGEWIRSAYGQPSNFTYWNMEVAFTAGWKRARAALAATGKQQVGEAQGSDFDIDDVRELFEKHAKGRDLTPDTWGVSSYVDPYVDNDWNEWVAAWKAIASRQPSGQEAFAYTRATSAVDPLPVITPAEYAALREQGMGESYRPLALIDGRDAGTGVGDE